MNEFIHASWKRSAELSFIHANKPAIPSYIVMNIQLNIASNIILEASLGVVQNLINVVGDIVTVTVEEEQMKIKKKLPEQT